MCPLRVYVVDPDEPRARWLERLAAARGYIVERFPNGERVIDRFVQRPADALLVQHVLPGRDGVATIEAIRWAPGGRDVRVVLLALEEPLTAPLHMLALRVDARAALVGPLEQSHVERELVALAEDWDDDRTLAVGDVSYAADLREARRRTLPPIGRPLPGVPQPEWLEVATVVAGAVRIETTESVFADELTSQNPEAAAAARAIGGARDPAPPAAFDDITQAEPAAAAGGEPTAPQRSLGASDAEAVLSSGRVGRPGARTSAGPGSRFASPTPTSQFRAPSSPPSVAVAPPARATPQPPMRPRAQANVAEGLRVGEQHRDEQHRDEQHRGEPPAAAPSSVRRSDVSTRQITLPREPAPALTPSLLEVAAVAIGPGILEGALDEGRFVSARAKETRRSEWAGTFSKTPFPALLRRIADERSSGGLLCEMRAPDPRTARGTVDKAPATKVVYFRGGVPVQVRSNVLDECLGQLLLRKKRIGVATLEESIRTMRARGGLQGQILVQMGALSPLELGELLSEQVRQKLFDLFGWRRGEFRFSSEMEAPRDGFPLEMALPDMVFEGVCAAMPATLLLDIMTPRLDLFVAPDPMRLSRFARVRIAKDLRTVLESIDGTSRLREVLRAGPRPGAIAQLLYALECLGAVSFEAAAEPRRVLLAPLSLEQAIDGRGIDTEWDDETKDRSQRPRLISPAATPTPPGAPPVAPRSGGPPATGAPDLDTVSASNLVELRSDSTPLDAESTDARRAHAEVRLAGADQTPPPNPRPSLPQGRPLDAHVERMFEAERCFRRGNRCLSRAEHRDALAAFERAAELCPDEGEFQAYLGWARHCVEPDGRASTEAALRDLERGCALAPDLHLTHLLRARVLEHAGHADAAEAYREVLSLAPGMQEAKEALTRLGRRR
ncbi:MAG: DUF4388 domain-containing protein [Deltaproteobacteria bacterium]